MYIERDTRIHIEKDREYTLVPHLPLPLSRVCSSTSIIGDRDRDRDGDRDRYGDAYIVVFVSWVKHEWRWRWKWIQIELWTLVWSLAWHGHLLSIHKQTCPYYRWRWHLHITKEGEAEGGIPNLSKVGGGATPTS